MWPLLIAPLLPRFHTELISPLSARSVVSSTSFLEYLLWSLQVNVSFALGIALLYMFLALGASVAGIITLAATVGHQVRRGEADDARVGALASFCGVSLLGLFMAGLASMNSRIPLVWLDARLMLDAGYLATLAGFVVALVGNTLIVLARGKAERPALV